MSRESPTDTGQGGPEGPIRESDDGRTGRRRSVASLGRVLRAVSFVGLVVALSTPAVAHGPSETGLHDVPLVTALIGGGVLVAGASVALDHRGALARRRADVGVFVGLAAILLGAGLFWL